MSMRNQLQAFGRQEIDKIRTHRIRTITAASKAGTCKSSARDGKTANVLALVSAPKFFLRSSAQQPRQETIQSRAIMLPNDSVPNDIMEDILQRRYVYVLIYYEPMFDLSEWKCLGVYNNQDVAKRTAIRTALHSIDSFNVYDPAKRYYEREMMHFSDGKQEWEDMWERTIGICVYTIETRRLDSDEAPLETLHFNFDAFMKRHIIEKDLTSVQTRALLKSWKEDPPYELLVGLFGSEEDEFISNLGKRDREAWLERYGSLAPYPYGEYDPL